MHSTKEELIEQYGFDEATADLLYFAFNTGESPSKLLIEAHELSRSACLTHRESCNKIVEKYEALYKR
jgi:hypothetical protein